VDALEREGLSGGGGSVVILRLRRRDAVDLGPRQHGDIHRRHATSTCALLLAAGLFIDLQSLVGDGAFLNLAMVEARCLFQCLSRRR
jgi:hypothetical protein